MVLGKFSSSGLGEVALNMLSICFLKLFLSSSFWQDVSVFRDGQTSAPHYDDMHHEIMVDSVISQSRHVETGRELQRWVPDADDPECPELENIFDGPWNRCFHISLVLLKNFLS